MVSTRTEDGGALNRAYNSMSACSEAMELRPPLSVCTFLGISHDDPSRTLKASAAEKKQTAIRAGQLMSRGSLDIKRETKDGPLSASEQIIGRAYRHDGNFNTQARLRAFIIATELSRSTS